MTTAPRQLNLQLDLPAYRPMVPLLTAVVLLDRHQDDVLSLIDTGKLTWAWDLASADAARKREVRIWRESLAQVLGGRATVIDHGAEDQVLESLFPHAGTEIWTPQLQRMFSCSQEHIANLLEQGELSALNVARRGPRGYSRITRSSIKSFLHARRIL